MGQGQPEFKDDMKGGHIVILVSLLQPVQILEEIEGGKNKKCSKHYSPVHVMLGTEKMKLDFRDHCCHHLSEF